jgi:DNA-directed RNA polymerase subunit RPC12/RpoP
MSVTTFTCPICGAEVSEALGPVGKPDQIAPEDVRCPKCGHARSSGAEHESGWIAYQHDRTKRFYCRVDHLYAHDRDVACGHNRITRQAFRNLDREGIVPPPVRCAMPECGKLLYGKRLVLTAGPGELIEPFVVTVEEVWANGVTKRREVGFINTDELAVHLVEKHRLDPDVAREKAEQMKPANRIVVEIGEGVRADS